MKVTDQFGKEFKTTKDLYEYYKIPESVFIGPKGSRQRVVPAKYVHALSGNKPTKKLELKKVEQPKKQVVQKKPEIAITIKAVDGRAPEEYMTITNTEYASIVEDLKVYREYAESLDNDYAQLKKTVDELQEKNSAMRSKLSSMNINKAISSGGITIKHSEIDMYKDEIAGILLKALRCLRNNTTSSASRQMDIVNDLISSLSVAYDDSTPDKVREKVSRAMAKAVNSKAGLDSLMSIIGFEKDRDSKHVKYIWHGDERYALTLSRTPSDYRSFENTIHDAMRMVYGPAYRKE